MNFLLIFSLVPLAVGLSNVVEGGALGAEFSDWNATADVNGSTQLTSSVERLESKMNLEDGSASSGSSSIDAKAEYAAVVRHSRIIHVGAQAPQKLVNMIGQGDPGMIGMLNF